MITALQLLNVLLCGLSFKFCNQDRSTGDVLSDGFFNVRDLRSPCPAEQTLLNRFIVCAIWVLTKSLSLEIRVYWEKWKAFQMPKTGTKSSGQQLTAIRGHRKGKSYNKDPQLGLPTIRPERSFRGPLLAPAPSVKVTQQDYYCMSLGYKVANNQKRALR